MPAEILSFAFIDVVISIEHLYTNTHLALSSIIHANTQIRSHLALPIDVVCRCSSEVKTIHTNIM